LFYPHYRGRFTIISQSLECEARGTDSISTRISLSFNRAFRSIESIFLGYELVLNTGTQSLLAHKKGAPVLSRDGLATLQMKSIRNRAVSLQVPIKDSKTTAIPYLLGSLPNLL
jgi:hypothetical protein